MGASLPNLSHIIVPVGQRSERPGLLKMFLFALLCGMSGAFGGVLRRMWHAWFGAADPGLGVC